MAGVDPGDAVVMLCGPGPMMEIAADHLLEIGVRDADIHYERFDFGAGKGKIDRKHRNSALAIFSVILASVVAFALR